MEKTFRKALFENFIQTCMNSNKYERSEAEIRYYCNLLTERALNMQDEGFQEMVLMYHDNVHQMEKTKTQFHDMVSFIEKTTTVVIENLKSMGMLTVTYEKSGKPVMKARTSVVTSMVDYLNKLNGLVIQFYGEIYKIAEESQEPDEPTIKRTQGSLF